ncbi:hypothetical protein CKO12_00200 [Chromatium okenii]|nr:hypothetical protein [Chromatium okenii]
MPRITLGLAPKMLKAYKKVRLGIVTAFTVFACCARAWYTALAPKRQVTARVWLGVKRLGDLYV